MVWHSLEVSSLGPEPQDSPHAGNAGRPHGPHHAESGIAYIARVDGILVQAYWSQQDGGWLIPDGSATTTTLKPIWSDGIFSGATQDLSMPTAPQAGTGTTIVGRQNTYVITTGGALWEHTGVTSFSASQYAADTVFAELSSGLWQASGRGANLTWAQVL